MLVSVEVPSMVHRLLMGAGNALALVALEAAVVE